MRSKVAVDYSTEIRQFCEDNDIQGPPPAPSPAPPCPPSFAKAPYFDRSTQCEPRAKVMEETTFNDLFLRVTAVWCIIPAGLSSFCRAQSRCCLINQAAPLALLCAHAGTSHTAQKCRIPKTVLVAGRTRCWICVCTSGLLRAPIRAGRCALPV